MSEMMEYVIEKFYPYFWCKFKFPIEDSIETDCTDTVKKLREAVWVHRIVSVWHWRPFLTMNLEPMVSSTETCVSFVFFMISTTVKDLSNIHESFVTSCSLVTGVAAYLYHRGHHEFLEYCPDILRVVFKENYCKSGRVQIWNYLRDHLITCCYSDAYRVVEIKTEGNPFADVVNDVEFVAEIKKIIKSKISVSKHAAVYRNTIEVLNRLKSRTLLADPLIESQTSRVDSLMESREIVSERSKSCQTAESLHKAEEPKNSASEQRVLEKFYKSDDSEQWPKNIAKQLSHDISTMNSSKSEAVKVASQSKKPLKDVETQKQSEDEQGINETKIGNLNLFSVQQLQKTLDDMKISEYEKRIATGVTETKKIPAFQLDGQSTSKNENERRIVGLEDQVKNLNLNLNLDLVSLTQSARLLKPENEQSASSQILSPSEKTTWGSEQTKKIPLFQLDEQSTSKNENERQTVGLEDQDMNPNLIYLTQSARLLKPENEQSASSQILSSPSAKTLWGSEQSFPTKSSNLSENDVSRIEGGFVTEKNDLDMPRETKDESQKSEPDVLHKSEAKNRKRTRRNRMKSGRTNPYPQDVKKHKMLGDEQSSTVQDKACDLTISPSSSGQSLQNAEKLKDDETSLPTKQVALCILRLLVQKLIDNHIRVCNLLEISVDN